MEESLKSLVRLDGRLGNEVCILSVSSCKLCRASFQLGTVLDAAVESAYQAAGGEDGVPSRVIECRAAADDLNCSIPAEGVRVGGRLGGA